MLGSDRLRTLLAGLARERRAPAPVAAPADEAHDARSERAPDGAPVAAPGANGARERRAAPVSTPLGIEAFLPGGEWRDARGAVYVHERLRSEMERPALHWGCLEAPSEDEEELLALVESGIGRALFLDLETGGLAASPVFLAGTMHWNGSDFVLRQYFGRHFGEGATLI